MNMKKDTRFKPGISGNQTTQWKPGQSGNPVGISKLRVDFERVFTEALVSQGTPDEAAQLLWAAARKGEPWAIRALCERFAPETHSLQILQEQNDEQLDYSKLSDEELNQLDALLLRASHQPTVSASRESPSAAA